MRYFVTIAQREHVVDIVPRPTGGYDVVSEGVAVEADVVMIGGALSMILDGQVVDLTVEGRPPAIGVIASGRRVYLEVESDRARAAAAARKKTRADGDGQLTSPMPGRVLKLLVAPGDEVEAGEPLVVVEAMKMENELRAPKAGRVEEVSVKPGDTVEAGHKLLRIA